MTLSPVAADVASTDQQLLNADSDQDNWLLHGRTYDNQRFSPLTQITRENVKRLSIKAMIHTGQINSFEATPLVVDGSGSGAISVPAADLARGWCAIVYSDGSLTRVLAQRPL